MDSDFDDFECAYSDCDGHIGDLWAWDTVRLSHPEYPIIPLSGVLYPL